MGYTNVVVDPMGNDEWERRGYKTWTIEDITAAEEPEAVKVEDPAKPAAPSDIKQGAFPGSIDDDFFIELARNNPESVQLIDVREPDEFEKGHIATARRMNVAEIRAAMDGFDTSERPIILYCATGARSGEAYFTFQDMRPDLEVYYLDANLSFTPDGSFEIK